MSTPHPDLTTRLIYGPHHTPVDDAAITCTASADSVAAVGTPLPMPDTSEFKMLEAIVSQAVEHARLHGECTERFHGWRVHVSVHRSGLAPWAQLVIDYHGVVWQQATWRLDWPRSHGTEPWNDGLDAHP